MSDDRINGEPINREHWLQLAIEKLRPIYSNAGYTIPALQISVGWPSAGGLAKRRPKHGEATAMDAHGGQDVAHMFVTPLYDDAMKVLRILTHELIHVCVGHKSGHRKPFQRAMQRLGLEGIPSEAMPGDELDAKLKQIADELGTYPHKALRADAREREKSRLLKAQCADCGYTVRVTRMWLDTGYPECPCGGVIAEGSAQDELDEDAEPDEQLTPSNAVLSFTTSDDRFEIQQHRQGKSQRWHVIDFEANARRACVVGTRTEVLLDAETRTTNLATRRDVLDFLTAARSGVYQYDTLDDHVVHEGDDELDELDEFIDDDDDEEPDYPEDQESAEPFEFERAKGITEVPDIYPPAESEAT